MSDVEARVYELADDDALAAAETLVKEGFLDVADICTGAYSKACKEAGLQ